MSKLKATRITMVYNGEVYEDFGTAPWMQLYYRKKEADKVIAELKAQKAQAEDDCAYWKTMARQRAEAFKKERHNKYKRCLAMAKWCHNQREIYERDSYNWELEDDAVNSLRNKANIMRKWRKRWLELAEKFKELKNAED